MNKIRTITASALAILLLMSMWVSVSRSQDETGRPVEDSLAPRPQVMIQSARAEWSGRAEEKLVRDVYARLMRYQSAARDFVDANRGTSSAPEEYLTFEIRNVHTGPVAEISHQLLPELVTPQTGTIIRIKPNHIRQGDGPAHAFYEAQWETAPPDDANVADPVPDKWRRIEALKIHDAPQENGPRDQIAPVGNAMAQVLSGSGEWFAAARRYTSYDVTVRLQGQERSYRAAMFYQADDGESLFSYRTEEERLAMLGRVRILDNITSEVNTVLNDASPRPRWPWNTYLESSLYSALVAETEAAGLQALPLVPAEAPVGYLPGDNLLPVTRDMKKFTSAMNCDDPTVHIIFSGSGIPLAQGRAPNAYSEGYANSVTMHADTNFLNGTYLWTTTSTKVELVNANTETVTVKSKSESATPGDVVIRVDFTVPDLPPAHDQIATTVQKPTAMKLVPPVAFDGANNECDANAPGRLKIITWQVVDKWDHPITAIMPRWDDMFIYKGRNGCILTLDGTAPGGKTAPDGRTSHRYFFCSEQCRNGGTCQTSGYQRYYVNGFIIDLPYTFSCNQITVAGDGSGTTPTKPSPKAVGDFVQDFWQGAFAQTPSDADWNYWSNLLASSRAQGQAQGLAEAQAMGAAFFHSQSYLDLNRSDEDYVYDLYISFLQRNPDQGGYDYWLSVLRSDNANGGNGREHLLTAFEVCEEFANLVSSLSN